MSDIRAYFGGADAKKAAPKVSVSIIFINVLFSKNISNKEGTSAKPARRANKRRIVDDEDQDEVEETKVVKKTIGKRRKEEEEELEEVDVSEYFANKAEPRRTTRTVKKEPVYEEIDGDMDLDDDNGFEPTVAKKGRSKETPKKGPVKKGYLKKEPVKPAVKASPSKAGPAKASPSKVLPKTMPNGSTKESAHDILARIPDAVLPEVDTSQKFSFAQLKAKQASAPQPTGTNEIPYAQPNCLAGMVFVFTGILPTLSREQGQDIVKRYGGKVTTVPSRNTTVVVLGSEAGPKKIETIKKNNIKAIDEDGFFQLLREMPADGGSGEAAKKAMEKKAIEEKKIIENAEEMAKELAKEEAKRTTASSDGGRPEDVLWTTKYAPTTLNHICGNKAAVERLGRWLSNWRSNAHQQFKNPGPDGNGTFRAAIIHGPPGIGKTTAAHLIADLQGYDVIESNASDTRSKSLLQSNVSQTLSNTSLLDFAVGHSTAIDQQQQKRNVCIVMDEVDGMSAGDRGGVGAMAALCKTTNVPIILVCNERSLPKMRPFDRVAFDVPFRRPDATAIRSRIMSIAHREGLKISAQVVDQLVESTRSDIRQIINILATFSVTNKTMDFDASKAVGKSWEKHTILKPFDIVARFLSGSTFAPSSKISLNDKIELYFHDHDFAPLMVQENYLNVLPSKASSTPGGHLELAARAAESIAQADLVDRMIHSSEQHWSLMPLHAVLSCVRPSYFVSGQAQGRYNFTSYLGQRSKAGKYSRLLQELHSHMRMKISGDAEELRMQYLPLLTEKILDPLIKDGVNGVDEVMTVMDEYFITKEDWDVIMELNIGAVEKRAKGLSTATKSAFTRTYNSTDHPVPFMHSGVGSEPKARKAPVPDLEDVIEDDVDKPDDEEGPVEEDIDITKDKYIKIPKAKAKAKAKAKPPAKPGATKGKAKAK